MGFKNILYHCRVDQIKSILGLDLSNFTNLIFGAVKIAYKDTWANFNRLAEECDAMGEQVLVGAPKIRDDESNVDESIVALL